MDLGDFLSSQRVDDIISLEAEIEASRRYNSTFRDVEERALVGGLMPSRYMRNRQTISTGEQLVLLRCRAAVIGCGGIGGYCIEELARLGVGTLVVVDPDIFVDHNLNRQILSSCALLGIPKVEAAARRVSEINPAVTTVIFNEAFTRENGKRLLAGVNVVLDGLDTIDARLDVAETCAELDIPFVHGAIGGWYGQVLTQQGSRNCLKRLYGRGKRNRGLEEIMGSPSFTPAVIASIQAAEACKILLAKGSLLERRLLTVNLLEGDFHILSLDEEP
jgi:molybdopterin/thiamine biosynthesis adenylyltransferase